MLSEKRKIGSAPAVCLPATAFCRLSCLLLLVLLLIPVASCSHAIAQTVQDKSRAAETTEVDVTIIHEINSRQLGSGYCGLKLADSGPVIDEEVFRKLVAPRPQTARHRSADRCAFLKSLKVDFSKHSLLVYRVSGDCFIRGTAKVTRDDTARKYTLSITKVYGGCRAAGSFEGWLVVDKLLPDHTVESVTVERDESGLPG